LDQFSKNAVANVTVEHTISLKNAMSLVGFNPRISYIVSQHYTYWVKGDIF